MSPCRTTVLQAPWSEPTPATRLPESVHLLTCLPLPSNKKALPLASSLPQQFWFSKCKWLMTGVELFPFECPGTHPQFDCLLEFGLHQSHLCTDLHCKLLQGQEPNSVNFVSRIPSSATTQDWIVWFRNFCIPDTVLPKPQPTGMLQLLGTARVRATTDSHTLCWLWTRHWVEIFHIYICLYVCIYKRGFLGGANVKNPPSNAGDTRDVGSIPGSGRFLGGAAQQPTPLFLPEESHGQRSLMGYNPWGCKELDTTEAT